MPRKTLLILLALIISTGAAFAQVSTPPLDPIGSFEAGDFRALAVTADGDRLLVADAENNQVRVYDFADPSQPALQSSLDVSGTPLLLAGGENYGLVAVTTETGDSLEAVAPALPAPNAEYVSGWGNVEIAAHPHKLALSPDGHWGVVIGDGGYTVLQIDGVGDIGSLTVEADMISVALSDTAAYVLHGQTLQIAPLNALEALQPSQVLNLDGVPSLVALNADASAGAFVVDGGQVVLFDPATLDKTGAFAVDGAPIASLHFLNSDGKQYLVVTQENSVEISVFDAADPQTVTMLDGGLSLENPVTALTVFGHYVIATDGVTIRIFST